LIIKIGVNKKSQRNDLFVKNSTKMPSSKNRIPILENIINKFENEIFTENDILN
jgi:hypothetical protein